MSRTAWIIIGVALIIGSFIYWNHLIDQQIQRMYEYYKEKYGEEQEDAEGK